MGLPIFESPAAAAALSEGDRVEIDVGAGIITDLDSGKFYRSAPVPDFMQDLIRAGGLINYIKSHQEKKPE
jgi:3-isopropylmalate/(R)-2-methylmalate dehydratase small subunit